MFLSLKRQWPFFHGTVADAGLDIKNIGDYWNDHDSGARAWTSLYTSGGFRSGLVSKSANYSIGQNDHVVLVNTNSGVVTLTLPSAVNCAGRQLIIKVSAGKNVAVINGASSQTIDGNTSITLPGAYFVVRLVSDGANWFTL